MPYDICNELEWFVNIIGDVNVLYRFCDDIDISDTRLSDYYKKDGLIFKSGHWYCKLPGGKIANSYKKNHQIKGTSHFCQTFSVMYWIGKDKDLVEYDFKGNFEKAAKFWLNELNDKKFRKFLMKKINKYEWKDENGVSYIPMMVNKTLKDFKYKDLETYLNWVIENSDTLKGCKQG